jgi:hypothetical protein
MTGRIGGFIPSLELLSEVFLKFFSSFELRKEEKRVLRLTTPNLHPADEDLSAGDPGTERRLGPCSLLRKSFVDKSDP